MTPDFTGTILNTRYALLRRIGHGGFATVYEALDRQIDKRVAVKVLNPRYSQSEEFRKRFIQEARAAARVRHRLLVDVSDQGVTADGTLFFVMELLRGVSLGDRIRDRPGPMPWRHVVAIAAELARALEYAHDHGIVHRDVKPGNIFLVEGPGHGDDLQIKLLDLGIAKIHHDVDTDAPETRESQGAPGTPEYMAPEQVYEGAKGPSVDLYAVGVLMYRLLTGSLPFTSKTPYAVLKMHVDDAPMPLGKRCPEAEIPARVEALVLKLMEKRPADRFANARELRGALQELLRADALAQRRPALAGLSQHRLIRITANLSKFTTAAITFMLLTLFTTSTLQSAETPPQRRGEPVRAPTPAVVRPAKAPSVPGEAPPPTPPVVSTTPTEPPPSAALVVDPPADDDDDDELEPAPARRPKPSGATHPPKPPPVTPGTDTKELKGLPPPPSSTPASSAGSSKARKDIERKLERSKAAIVTKCKKNIVPETLTAEITVDLASGAPSARIQGQSSPQRECVRSELEKLKYTSVRGAGTIMVSTKIAI